MGSVTEGWKGYEIGMDDCWDLDPDPKVIAVCAIVIVAAIALIIATIVGVTLWVA